MDSGEAPSTSRYPQHRYPTWLRYGVAIMVTVAVTGVAHELDPVWDTSSRHPYLVEWPTVIIAAYVGGLGPGLLASVLSTLAILFLWIEPGHSLRVHRPSDYLALALYAMCAFVVASLIERLHRARAEEQRMRRSREVVLGVVAHDLRNPLGSISMASALLRKKPDELQRLDTIDRATRRMDRLIEDLLDASVLDSAAPLKMVVAEEELTPIVSEAMTAAAPSAARKGIALITDVKPDLRVRCDRGRLLQVLGNLMDNAAKFTPEGGCITVRAVEAGGFVRMEVADTGPGIRPEQRDFVFERHWTGGHRAGGSGLGLFIARGIVRAHGGRIWLDTEQGRGTTFFFTVPLARPGSSRTYARDRHVRERTGE